MRKLKLDTRQPEKRSCEQNTSPLLFTRKATSVSCRFWPVVPLKSEHTWPGTFIKKKQQQCAETFWTSLAHLLKQDNDYKLVLLPSVIIQPTKTGMPKNRYVTPLRSFRRNTGAFFSEMTFNKAWASDPILKGSYLHKWEDFSFHLFSHSWSASYQVWLWFPPPWL